MTVILRGITWEHPRGYDCQVACSTAFGLLHPDIVVRWEYRSLQAFADAPIEDLAERYDLLVIDHPHIPLAAAAGAFARLDGAGFDDELAALANQSVGRSHESYAHDGHQYGLASDAAAQVSAHRPDLLAAPPTTWDEVLELAADGRVVWPLKPIDAYSSLITIAGNRASTGHGEAPTSRPGHFLAEEDTLAALADMRRLAELVPAVNLGQNPIEVAEMLVSDDPSAYSPLLFGYSNYSRVTFRQHRLQYGDIPTIAPHVAGTAGAEGGQVADGADAPPRPVSGSLLGGAGIAVSAHTSHPDEARRYAFWVASAHAQRSVYFDGGGQPGNAAAWDDDRLNRETLDFFRRTRRTLEAAYVRPRTPGYIEFQDRVSPWVTETIAGRTPEATLARRLNEAAAELLDVAAASPSLLDQPAPTDLPLEASR
ncbi:sugar ABC transporter substrate-binding protein [Leifsonia sp. ALI-44-B]|uniref:extracellular solute-binding protein n=1 Tax=Leifsonia sp. ALI-44-B TaxID=1933776 RepID=UPI00097C454F|nr:extracellular solute-binding protein [Leifsonia sp. ALI-44-B]ONI61022.1 sugar ABC transporter substrate-binding protein [Leifsonia sp. ALI-44-B]